MGRESGTGKLGSLGMRPLERRLWESSRVGGFLQEVNETEAGNPRCVASPRERSKVVPETAPAALG